MLKNKNYYRGLLTGAIISLALNTMPVVGQTIQSIKAHLSPVKVEIQGQEITEPTLTYNQRTYVPIRVISEQLGYEVIYDHEDLTAKIQKTK